MLVPRVPLLTLLGMTSLGLALACGGGGVGNVQASTGTQTTPLSADTASALTTAFLVSEFQQATPSALPSLHPAGDEGVYGLALPTPSCVSATLGGTNTVTYTFNSCTGPDGATLTGQLQFTFQSSEYTLTFLNLRAAKGAQSWTLNGTKRLQINTVAKQAQITVTAFSMAFADTANAGNNRTFTYSAGLVSDWATAGTYKLSGTATLQASGSDPILLAIPAATPLTWTAQCCYPVSGTLTLQQGSAQAVAAFGLPCGTLTLTPAGRAPVVKVMAACP